jgi:hypothetical protein
MFVCEKYQYFQTALNVNGTKDTSKGTVNLYVNTHNHVGGSSKKVNRANVLLQK